MSNVAVLGLGAMGSRMAKNLLKAGHAVTVWNRNAQAAERLAAGSAVRVAASPRAAAQGQDFILAMVRDDRASREVWLGERTGALHGMSPGAVAIESSTLTPAWITELGNAMGRSGFDLLEAPVSGSTPQAESATLIFLVGGRAEVLVKAEPVLSSLGSNIQHAGSLGSGTLAKLITNTLMGVQLSTLAQVIGMVKRNGADPAQVLQAVSATALWNPYLARDSKSMLTNDFAPRFPVVLLEKDLGYTVETAGGEPLAPTVAAARRVFQNAVADGLGDENMTAVVKLFQPA